MKFSRWRRHALALGIIALVTCVYSWPLLSRLSSAIPGVAKDHDVATMAWNVGWVQHALLTGADLLHTDMVFAPFTVDLRLHTYGLLQGLMVYPLTGILGVIGAYNAAVILTLFLNGATLYALIRGEVQNRLASVIAAVWTMLGTPLLFQINVGRPAFGSIWITCLALMVARRLFDEPKWWHGVALGGLLLAALLSDFQIVLFTALWLVIYGVYRLASDQRKILTLKHVLVLGLAGLIFALPFFALFYPALSSSVDAGYPQPTLEGMMLYSFRLADYFTPGVLELVYGYELLAALIIALVIFRRRGGYGFWWLGGVGMLVLALGPYFQPSPEGHLIPLPFALLSLWKPLSNFRTPYRLAMPALIGLGVVAGYVLAWGLPRIRSRWVLGVVAVVITAAQVLFAVVHDPFNVQTYPAYAFYQQIADEPGDFTLLEVPFGVRSGLDRIGNGGEILQIYQSIHHKRLINGMIARLPVSIFRFYRSHPSLLFLAGEAPLSDNLDADFEDMLQWSGTRYVLVHTALMSDEDQIVVKEFLDRQPELQAVGNEGDMLIYRVKGN